jgi:hypothetical protein
MTALVADSTLPERLKSLTEAVRVIDDAGRTLGYFQPAGFAPPGWAKAHSPTDREELERRRAEYRRTKQGKPLADILPNLAHPSEGEAS